MKVIPRSTMTVLGCQVVPCPELGSLVDAVKRATQLFPKECLYGVRVPPNCKILHNLFKRDLPAGGNLKRLQAVASTALPIRFDTEAVFADLIVDAETQDQVRGLKAVQPVTHRTVFMPRYLRLG